MISQRSENVIETGERPRPRRVRFDQSGSFSSENVLPKKAICAMVPAPRTLSLMSAADFTFVQLNEKNRALAQAAARREFPQCTIAIVNSVEEALMRDSAADQLLVFGADHAADAERAAAEKDSTGLTRWAVVVLGQTQRGNDATEFVAREELDEATVARAFRTALARHRLARENERLRGDLLAVASRVSHDLRTPLGGVLTAGEVVKEFLAEKSQDPSVVRPVFDSAEEIGALLDRVSFVLKASARPLPRQLSSLAEIVWAALQRNEPEAVRLNALLIEPENWPEVECVPSWTERIFTNLISNALKHGGNPPRVELSWQRLDDVFRFCVRDNGPGVREEIRPTLFQPFHSLHRLNGSRGLGLSLTQRLVEIQGGTCGYEPLPNGSRFFFTLPAVNKATENR